MLVEDSEFDAVVLRYALSHVNVGAELDVVTSVAALHDRLARNERIADFIIVDLSLGDGTGFDVISGIRSSAQNRVVPIVVMSGSTDNADIGLAYAAGANAYIVKSHETANTVHALRCLNDFWFGVVRLP